MSFGARGCLVQVSDLLGLVGATISLSAYLSTVRFRLIHKRRKDYARALSLAGVPLVTSGTTLGVCAGLKFYKGWDCADGIAVGIGIFGLALVALVVPHVDEWWMTLKP